MGSVVIPVKAVFIGLVDMRIIELPLAPANTLSWASTSRA